MQDVLDIWLKVQGVWQYLEPIFGSEDIMRQMPKEGALFKRQDGMWRENMVKVNEDVTVLKVVEIPNLLESYKEQHELLEQVQKGLNDYLEVKRLFFPRFFFLSNDELLEILSQTKDPTRVQPFLSKVFEAMASVTFTEDNVITQMASPEGEIIDFVTHRATKGKAVEYWMGEVEDEMREAIRNWRRSTLRD